MRKFEVRKAENGGIPWDLYNGKTNKTVWKGQPVKREMSAISNNGAAHNTTLLKIVQNNLISFFTIISTLFQFSSAIFSGIVSISHYGGL